MFENTEKENEMNEDERKTPDPAGNELRTTKVEQTISELALNLEFFFFVFDDPSTITLMGMKLSVSLTMMMNDFTSAYYLIIFFIKKLICFLK